MSTRSLAWASLGLGALIGGCACPKPKAPPPPPRCVVEPSPTAYLLKLDEPVRIEERILVAHVAIAKGTPLRASLLEVRAPQTGFEWQGHLRPVDLVHFSGQRLKRDIAIGEPVRRTDLEGNGAEASRADLLPPGARAVTLRVDWVGGRGTWVKPGDHVDVGLVREGVGAERPSVMLLMQDARVLVAESLPEAGSTPPVAPWVSVLALPREAAGLTLAQRLGRIVLFPRGVTGPRGAMYPPVTLKDLESPAFWQNLQKERQRTLRSRQAPDDPGIQVK